MLTLGLKNCHKLTIPQHILIDSFILDLQITYSISACMVTLCHVFWTVLFWDGCHKKGTTSTWWLGVCFAVISHYAMSALVKLFLFSSVGISYFLFMTSLLERLLFNNNQWLINDYRVSEIEQSTRWL